MLQIEKHHLLFASTFGIDAKFCPVIVIVYINNCWCRYKSIVAEPPAATPLIEFTKAEFGITSF